MPDSLTFTVERFGTKEIAKFVLASYHDFCVDGRTRKLAVQLHYWVPDSGGYWELGATVSENTEDELQLCEFVAKNYSENEGLPEQLIALGLCEDTGKRVSYGYVSDQPILRITEKGMRHAIGPALDQLKGA